MAEEQAAIPAEVSAETEAAPEVETQDTATEPEVKAIEADPTLSKKEKEQAKKNIRKFKLKVDGKDYEEELDLDNEQEVIKQLQFAKVSQKRMAEKAELEKTVNQFFEELKKNPRKVLSNPDMGIDLKKIAIEMIEEEIANSTKSPEQLEKEKLQTELKNLKDEREKEKETSKKRELERLQAQEYERFDNQISTAIDKSTLPKTAGVVRKVADYMLIGLQAGYDITPDDVMSIVEAEYKEDLSEMFRTMPEDAIEALIGKDVFKKVRKKNLEKLKTDAPQVTAKTATQDLGQGKQIKKEEPKKVHMKDFFKF